MAYKVMSQYGTAAAPMTNYYCDDQSDLDQIKNADMGATAFIIHTADVYMADSSGVWYKI